MDGNPSWFDEQCSAKLVTAYVTDVNGDSAVVNYKEKHIRNNYLPLLLCAYRFPPLQVEDVPHHLVEQVQQPPWSRE